MSIIEFRTDLGFVGAPSTTMMVSGKVAVSGNTPGAFSSSEPANDEPVQGLSMCSRRAGWSRHVCWALVVLSWLGAFAAQNVGAVECISLDFVSEQPVSVIFVGDFESGVLEPWGNNRVFSAVEVLDIDFIVGFDQLLGGDHVLEMVLTTPNGHMYQKLAVPISSDSGKTGTFKKIREFPRPMRIRITEKQAAGGEVAETVKLSLPVGGTSIETASIYGGWSVQLFLDGQPLGCGTDTSFVIVQ